MVTPACSQQDFKILAQLTEAEVFTGHTGKLVPLGKIVKDFPKFRLMDIRNL